MKTLTRGTARQDAAGEWISVRAANTPVERRRAARVPDDNCRCHPRAYEGCACNARCQEM